MQALSFSRYTYTQWTHLDRLDGLTGVPNTPPPRTCTRLKVWKMGSNLSIRPQCVHSDPSMDGLDGLDGFPQHVLKLDSLPAWLAWIEPGFRSR